ncbi:MAG: S8 family serine peptidase, partial [Thermoleophilia bacterium]|nr:S8 family serine peptidase [Thermoleophilia bacterium]
MAAAITVLALVGAGVSWGAASYDPATDNYSMYNVTAQTGAAAWWNAGYTGAGVDVAVIDTGVSPVPGLDGPGKIINGPDLSLESQNPAFRYLDTNGHGTFMAGLIAGKDSTLTAPYSSAPASAYRGMAPDARIVSIKVGVADGGADVSQVIAAIDWVVQHRNDNGLNIRVINLSYGTNSLQGYEVDPLSFAVEQAWKQGIVVVAAAGNSGYQVSHGAPGLADPAYNPYVIAVGGSDSMGTASLGDDTIGGYSASAAIQCSTGCKTPDVAAPGSHLQGLRVPNSFLDQNHPEGRLGDRFFRGSGTSQSAAITSGAIALILQKNPRYTPDQVKSLLGVSASKLVGITDKLQGAGEIDLTAALTASIPKKYAQSFTASTGTGLLEGSRGTDHVTDDGVLLQGEIDIFGHAFNSSAMAALEAAGNSWSGGTWNGNSWSGNSWSGNSWSGNSWSGNSWSGNSWSGNSWSGNSWSGNSWSGNSWFGNSWSGGS